MAELIIMPCRKFEPFLVRQGNQCSRLSLVNCKRLLHIDVASPFQAQLRNLKMALRGRRDVNNVGPSFAQEFYQVAEIPFNWKPLIKLTRHQRFPVTNPDDLASLDSLN